MNKLSVWVLILLLSLSFVMACHCGDGIINVDHNNNILDECDDGSITSGGTNGIPCDPECDSSCTYCSTTCTLETVHGDSCKGIDEECSDAGFDFGIAKWEWYSPNWVPEGAADGTLVEGDDHDATYASGLEEGTIVAAAIVVKAGGNRDVYVGGSGSLSVGDPALSHITFCGNNPECGNGIVEGDEVCDDGDDNGEWCNPGLTSCSYCSETCEEITIDTPCVPSTPDDIILDLGLGVNYIVSYSSYGAATLGPFSVVIPRGNYDVTLVSHDGYPTRASSSQPNEQWFLKLSDDNPITSTSETSDLPDGVNYITVSEVVDTSLVIDRDVTEVVAQHAYYPDTSSPNSVRPFCAVFTPVDYCGNGIVEGGEVCDDGNLIDGDGCSATCDVEPLIIKAYKVVCEAEEYLPDWGLAGVQPGEPATLGATTAADFVAANDDYCWLEDDWHFQWGYSSVPKLDGSFIGPAPVGIAFNEWKNFDTPTTNGGPAEVEVYDLQGSSKLWIRENLQEGYVPFVNPPGDLQDPVSAELYCGNDVLNFDNYDWIKNLALGQTYYCVAFNAFDHECGDGTIDSDEVCDDGVNNGVPCIPTYGGSCTYCSELCEEVPLDGPWCGDGTWQPAYEDCESDEGVPEHYTCTAQCTLEYVPYCGDGITDFDEECDANGLNGVPCTPGYAGSCTYCTAVCEEETLYGPVCGDGIINNPPEVCDDGVENTEQSCTPAYGSSCSWCDTSCEPHSLDGHYCGDGVVNDASEDCDGTDGVGPHQECTAECTLTDLNYCGDGVVQSPNDDGFDEECDGLAGVGPHQECSDTCTIIDLNYCGDGVVQSPNDDGFDEECDGTDGVGLHQECSVDCTLQDLTYCGDGVVQSPNDDGFDEECDGLAGVGSHQECSVDCILESVPYCGDGFINQPSEQCDGSDGVGPHETCLPDCTLESVPYCGDGVINQPFEVCDLDDGVGPHQECSVDCTLQDLTYCGDGVIQFPNDDGGYEICDGSAGVGEHQECSVDCTLQDLTYCGDGVIQSPNDDGFDEECDGGAPEGFMCTQECLLEEIPTCLDIDYIDPYYADGTSQWINTVSRVELNVDTEVSACVEGDHYYRYQEVDNAYCLGVCDAWVPGDDSWSSYTDVFSLPTEACYVIEYYSDTSFGESDIGWDCIFHDMTPPVINKTVGLPSRPMPLDEQILGANFYSVLDPEGEDYCAEDESCWQVSMDTEIIVDCDDVGNYPSGVDKICYTVGLDGDDATADYCDGTMEDGLCCMGANPFLLTFKEESWHELNITCVDHVNKSSFDREYFKVTGDEFTLHLNKKWNLISVPFTLLNDSPEHVFGNNLDVAGVWYYDAVDESWLIWKPGVPSNLEHVVPGAGYWVLTTNETAITLFGHEDIHPELYVEIVHGWNLVGYYGTEGLDSFSGYAGAGKTAECALNTLSTSYEMLGWSSLLGYWEPLNPDPWLHFDESSHMDPGAGYWLFATSDGMYAPSTTC